ncbi:hypothetical protein CMK11_20180 [Candidatus Poribacteria bacterium]|nr:hypothetical protein [Candidatus Poribacteria bacterium]
MEAMELPELTDRAAVVAARRGDAAAFASLVRRHMGLVRSIAIGKGVGAADVDDIAQETFLAAYARLGQLRTPDRFAAWLARIAHRCAHGHLRRQESAQARELATAGPTSEAAAQDEHDRASDRASIVSAALRALPESLRLPLAMHYFADASPNEIAHALSLSRGAVDSRLYRARDEMRRYLRRCGLDGEAMELLPSCGPVVLAASDVAVEEVMRRLDAAAPHPAASGSSDLAVAALGAVACIATLSAALGFAPVQWGGLRRPAQHESRRQRNAPGVVLFAPSPSTVRLLIRPGDEAYGWVPHDPTRDATAPTRAGTDASGAPMAVTSNAYGVCKPIPPTSGEVTLRLRLKTAPAAMDACLGFMFGGSMSAQTLLRKDETDTWYCNRYVAGNAPVRLGDARGDWRDVIIVYRTWSGAYDLYMDGALVAEDETYDPSVVGLPVTGVYMSSGRGDGGWPLHFSGMRVSARDGAALRAARPARALAPRPAPKRDRMTLHAGELAGQALDPSRPQVRVSPGNSVVGWLDVSVLNTHKNTAEFHVIETPTWGAPDSAYRVFPAATPHGETRHTVRIDRRAPETPGKYRLILAGAAETEPGLVASGTNWPVGSPVWRNGTDIAEWSEELIGGAIANGSVMAPWLHGRDDVGASEVAAVAVEVVVERM